MSHVNPTSPRPASRHRSGHRHMWLMGLVGIASGLALLVYAPTLRAVSGSLLLLAGFHIAGAVVLGGSLWVTALRRMFRRAHAGRAKPVSRLDFGWGPGWMNGLALAAVVAFAAAVAVQVEWPTAWPLALLLTAQAVLFAVGNAIMRGFRQVDQALVPMVSLSTSSAPLILDAGCGAGRTTIALSRGLPTGQFVALDRFDADYIDGGGRWLLDRNLAFAGLADRVRVEAGDLAAMPFGEATFDAVVSTNVYDHLGGAKAAVLRETCRVLKPGGRFLMAVWVPSWSLFAVGSFLSLALTRRSAWRRLVRDAGFEILDEGTFNNAWFLLLARPLL